MAGHRRTGLLNQRTLPVEPEGAATLPTEGEPIHPPVPPPSLPSAPSVPFRDVVSSSDALWERRLQWLRARERFKVAPSLEPAPTVDPPTDP